MRLLSEAAAYSKSAYGCSLRKVTPGRCASHELQVDPGSLRKLQVDPGSCCRDEEAEVVHARAD